ncbi:hotdog fold thioesterase [Pseudodesulfovibrio cashew]|uniref:Hotdog fold thioesterase n=1 Tax=Pseudodesulfovibrio cashew TaxID=2678688 RepID=A0A6I6JGZ2_9BACT|nr:PaaI family thioesterase [Pseudodesulfovibrio cashew]QGY39632.1 hotdog fold thioesterase [Pseudodesulfovibrio cashew]
MPENYLAEVRKPGQQVNPLFAFLGVEILEIVPDRAALRLPVVPGLIQGGGKLAGGILATLLDEAMAHAALGGNAPGRFTTTVDLNVSYFRPAGLGDVLECEAKVVKRGGRVLFTEALVTRGEKEIARATASFLVV